jgi:hypothetical protein
MRFAWQPTQMFHVEHLCRLPRLFGQFANNKELHRFTGSQVHKIQALWNCGIAASILLGLSAQFHSITVPQKPGFVEL